VERYERALEDVFAIHEEIAQTITATVARRIIQASELAASRRQPEDIRAYDLLHRGNRLADTFTPDAQAKAHALFEQVLRVDPGFARAHTGLGWLYLNHATDDGVGVPREQDPNRIEALRQAEEAFALDPNDPRVHSTLGYICLTRRQFDRADRHMDLARKNPNDPLIQILWACVQACLRRRSRRCRRGSRSGSIPVARVGTTTIAPASCFNLEQTVRRLHCWKRGRWMLQPAIRGI
jgi:tetratricopeptide (TPR) repeat protein